MEDKQKEGCRVQFDEAFRRLDNIEKYNTDTQNERVSNEKMMVRFEMMFDNQNETNRELFTRQDETTKSILKQFDDYRQENIAIGKERDLAVKELSDNILKISNGMAHINAQMEKNDKKIETIDKKLESIDDKSKIDFLVMFKSSLIVVLSGCIGAAISYVIKLG